MYERVKPLDNADIMFVDLRTHIERDAYFKSVDEKEYSKVAFDLLKVKDVEEAKTIAVQFIERQRKQLEKTMESFNYLLSKTNDWIERQDYLIKQQKADYQKNENKK